MRTSTLRSATALLFSVAALAACDAADDLTDSLNFPITFDATVALTLNVGEATGAAAGQPTPIAASYPVDGPPVRVDLASQNSQLAANRSKLQSITLTGLTVTPTTNTLTHASPPLDVYIGAATAQSSAGAARIATIPSIPAGSTAVVTAMIDDAGQAAAQTHLGTLDFTVIPAATIAVDAGQTVPGGAVGLDIALGIRAVVNPTK